MRNTKEKLVNSKYMINAKSGTFTTHYVLVQVFRWPKKGPPSNLAFQAFEELIGT